MTVNFLIWVLYQAWKTLDQRNYNGLDIINLIILYKSFIYKWYTFEALKFCCLGSNPTPQLLSFLIPVNKWVSLFPHLWEKRVVIATLLIVLLLGLNGLMPIKCLEHIVNWSFFLILGMYLHIFACVLTWKTKAQSFSVFLFLWGQGRVGTGLFYRSWEWGYSFFV